MDNTEFPVQPSVPELTGRCSSFALSHLQWWGFQAAPHGRHGLWSHQLHHLGPVPGKVRSRAHSLRLVSSS